MPLQTVVAYIQQVASPLQYTRDQRMIHRDLKPENLLLGHDQQIWLSDFGLAMVADSARSRPVQQTAGTLACMAPEQLRGHATAPHYIADFLKRLSGDELVMKSLVRDVHMGHY